MLLRRQHASRWAALNRCIVLPADMAAAVSTCAAVGSSLFIKVYSRCRRIAQVVSACADCCFECIGC